MAFGPRLKANILLLLFRSQRFDPSRLDQSVMIHVYGSDIKERLARIHAHPERDGPNGTLVVVLHGRTPAHVRCAFEQDGTMLVCEVRGGLYRAGQDAQPPPFSAETEVGLKATGYWRDPASGRYVFDYEVGEDPDRSVWGGACVTILNPLIGVFGAQARSKIEIVAPLAPKRDGMAIRLDSGR
jgi:hypothetical protein